MARGHGRLAHVVVACDDADPVQHPGRGGCGRPITEITTGSDGNVEILGPVLAQNGDPGGTLTAVVPGVRPGRRRGALVIDSTDPADRPLPQLRADLLEARRLAHEAGVPFPDGVPYPDALAGEIAKHERLVIEWDPAGASSRLGRRTFCCLCGRGRAHGAGRLSGFAALPGRVAVVTQAQLNGAYRQAVEGGRRRITLDDLRRAAG
jgi:hypothetical protein